MSANKDKSISNYNEFRRTRYFHGMLLDDKDFRGEQSYHAGKRRLLNRMLHGSGIVCGLQLEVDGTTGRIQLDPGLALDCCGNEIWVNKKWEGSIAQLWPPQKATPESNPCSDPGNAGPRQYHLVIRYDEKDTDPVSVYLPGAGCDDRACEHSRTKEGYALELREGADCSEYESASQPCSPPGDCPDCGPCDKPCYLILGTITEDPQNPDGRFSKADHCRKYVITGRLVRQMIVSAFTPMEPAPGTGSRGIVIPGTDTPTNDPVEALCSLFGFLRDLPGAVVPKTDFEEFKTDIEARLNGLEGLSKKK
jgi:hypothetical protein